MSRQSIDTREPATKRVTPGPDRHSVPLRGLRALTATYAVPLGRPMPARRGMPHRGQRRLTRTASGLRA